MLHKAKKHNGFMIILLILFTIAAIGLFTLTGLNANNWDYNLPRRLIKIAAIALTGSSIAVSSLVFQTITNNRILTPSVMGIDSLYMFLQTVIIFCFGSGTLAMMSKYTDFALSCGLMVAFSLLLYRIVFHNENRNLFVLVLVGMVFGSFFQSLSSFMQALIDPNEFLILQGKMFASFNNINLDILMIAAIGALMLIAYILLQSNQLDAMALGRENAISLGINYDRQVLKYLVIISLLVSISTALVGPVTFLGVMVVNLSRQLLQTFRHITLLMASSLISVFALVMGQYFVERVFAFHTVISVIINFAGGIYFIYLLLKERKV